MPLLTYRMSASVAITPHGCRKLIRPRWSSGGYDSTAEYSRHRQLVLQGLNCGMSMSAPTAGSSGEPKRPPAPAAELADIINAMLEELVRQRFVLPGVTLLLRIAQEPATR